MPTWNDLIHEVDKLPPPATGQWLTTRLTESLSNVADLRGRNVLMYSSAFLQKPTLHPISMQITAEDLNGLMATMHGMDWSKGLALLLHTPGGVTNATETLVAYLRSKFDFIEVIVPALAMSAGTMISLAANQIVMGRQSQLGPIDPQMQIGGRIASARAIVDQFEMARDEILVDPRAAHVWAPIVANLGPSLLIEARNALEYGERMVGKWVAERMLNGEKDAREKGAQIAKHFNDAGVHKSHGRRIDREEARTHGVKVLDLEEEQALQEAVLTAYHLATIIFQKSPAAKLIASMSGKIYVNNGPAQPPR